MASSFLMLPSEVVRENRGLDAPDEAMKRALLELGRVIASALDDALLTLCEGISVEALGCQGVRPDIRPAFPYAEGTELLIGEASARFMESEPFGLILMLPALRPTGR